MRNVNSEGLWVKHSSCGLWLCLSSAVAVSLDSAQVHTETGKAIEAARTSVTWFQRRMALQTSKHQPWQVIVQTWILVQVQPVGEWGEVLVTRPELDPNVSHYGSEGGATHVAWFPCPQRSRCSFRYIKVGVVAPTLGWENSRQNPSIRRMMMSNL